MMLNADATAGDVGCGISLLSPRLICSVFCPRFAFLRFRQLRQRKRTRKSRDSAGRIQVSTVFDVERCQVEKKAIKQNGAEADGSWLSARTPIADTTCCPSLRVAAVRVHVRLFCPEREQKQVRRRLPVASIDPVKLAQPHGIFHVLQVWHVVRQSVNSLSSLESRRAMILTQSGQINVRHHSHHAKSV